MRRHLLNLFMHLHNGCEIECGGQIHPLIVKTIRHHPCDL